MIIIKILIGISIIVLTLIALYAIGRIAYPILDPTWRLVGRPHYILIMLAGIAALAVLGLIGMACVMGYAVGEAVMHCIQ